MLRYEDGYIVDYVGGKLKKKYLANEFRLKSNIIDNTMHLVYLGFINFFGDYVVLDGSSYKENDSEVTTPDFNEILPIQINGVEVPVTFSHGIGQVDVSSYNGPTEIYSKLAGVDNIKFILNDNTNELLHAQIVKDEAYKEYIEVSEIYGTTSDKALAAKQAYIDACNNCSVKSRAELESELVEVTKDANKWFGYVMELEGWW